MTLHLTRVAFTVLLLAVLGFVSNTPAAPILRATIIVESEVVTLGDLFDNLPAEHTKPVFRAPALGTTGTITLPQLNAALAAAHMSTYDANGLNHVQISRSGKHFTQADLAQIIAQTLLTRNLITPDMQVELSLDTPLPTLVLPLSAPTLEITAFSHGFPLQNFTAKLSHLNQSLDISGRLTILAPTVRAATNLSAGTILTLDHLQISPVNISALQGNTPLAIADALGKQTTRSIPSGAPLRMSDIAAPSLINRSQQVTLVYTNGALTLTAKGQALSNAAYGQSISVLNLATRKTLQGIVTAQGTVTVHTHSLNFAALQ